jgi:hypothetical protein
LCLSSDTVALIEDTGVLQMVRTNGVGVRDGVEAFKGPATVGSVLELKDKAAASWSSISKLSVLWVLCELTGTSKGVAD